MPDTTSPPSTASSKLALPDIGRSPTVLLLVDFVNPLDFPGAAQLRPSALAAARATARLKRRLSAAGAQTIYANDNYGDWHADFGRVWQRCSRAPDEAGQIARAIKPLQRDFTLLKPRHSAFYATPLKLLLSQLHCRRLVVTGLAADSCVLYTAMDAYLRGLALWVPEDCTAAETPRSKAQALEQMKRTLKAKVNPSNDP